MKIGERKSPALGGTPGLTLKHTTARGKTVVKAKFKFTLFRVIVKSNLEGLKTTRRGRKERTKKR
jgi:hypothetical protein